jgi:hypothetical protein
LSAASSHWQRQGRSPQHVPGPACGTWRPAISKRTVLATNTIQNAAAWCIFHGCCPQAARNAQTTAELEGWEKKTTLKGPLTSAPAGCVSPRLFTSSFSSALLAADGSFSSVMPSSAVGRGAMCLQDRAGAVTVPSTFLAEHPASHHVCTSKPQHHKRQLDEAAYIQKNQDSNIYYMAQSTAANNPPLSACPSTPTHTNTVTHRMSVLVGSTLSSSSMIRQWGQLARDSTRRSLKRPTHGTMQAPRRQHPKGECSFSPRSGQVTMRTHAKGAGSWPGTAPGAH